MVWVFNLFIKGSIPWKQNVSSMKKTSVYWSLAVNDFFLKIGIRYEMEYP